MQLPQSPALHCCNGLAQVCLIGTDGSHLGRFGVLVHGRPAAAVLRRNAHFHHRRLQPDHRVSGERIIRAQQKRGAGFSSQWDPISINTCLARRGWQPTQEYITLLRFCFGSYTRHYLHGINGPLSLSFSHSLSLYPSLSPSLCVSLSREN